jgi:hypothetical protein
MFIQPDNIYSNTCTHLLIVLIFYHMWYICILVTKPHVNKCRTKFDTSGGQGSSRTVEPQRRRYVCTSTLLILNLKEGREDTDEFSWCFITCMLSGRDSSVGIELGYGLEDRGSRVRFPGGGAGNFSLHHRVQNGSGAHPASYPTGTKGSFPGGKTAEAWSWPLTSI